MEMAASKIPQDVREANSKLSKALDFYSSIDRWDLPNRFRVQDIDPVLFDHQIIDIKQYNAWEDQHLTPQQKNDIAKLIYERFKDDTDIATQNYFFVVEHTSEGVDALAGAIGARAARSRNPQPPIKPQGISKGSNIKEIKVNWGQAKTFINDRFEALQKSVGQLPKNKLAYDGPSSNYKPSTQKPLEPTKNQIEVRKYYPGTEPENSASGSASGKNKNSSGEGTPKASNVGNVVKDGNKTKYTNPAGNELIWDDQHPKNINRDIDNLINSKDPGKSTEAKVAAAVRENKEVTAFGQKIQRADGNPAGDLDVVTKSEIIEVKKSLKAVTDVEQFDKYVKVNHESYLNHDHKKVILYIDKPLTNLHHNDLKKLEIIKSKGVTIVNSIDELKGVLK
jgi:hypothetical protein